MPYLEVPPRSASAIRQWSWVGNSVAQKARNAPRAGEKPRREATPTRPSPDAAKAVADTLIRQWTTEGGEAYARMRAQEEAREGSSQLPQVRAALTKAAPPAPRRRRR